VLLSTHVLSEVSPVCDRVVIMNRGRVVAEDSAAALVREQERGERTLLRVEGPAAQIVAALRALPGVEQVELDGSTDPIASLIVSTQGEPRAPALAAAVISHGWGLLELRPLAMTLEDLYVRLVGAAEQPPPA
jgi:ABC-2 type transport system ATP-binding protein